jgi:hypothetical protein
VAKIVLAEDLILSKPNFNPARAELKTLLDKVNASKKAQARAGNQSDTGKKGKSKSALGESQSLTEAFTRELQHLLHQDYLQTVIDWLKVKLAEPDSADEATERREWAHIEVATSSMLSVLVHLGWSFQSLCAVLKKARATQDLLLCVAGNLRHALAPGLHGSGLSRSDCTTISP